MRDHMGIAGRDKACPQAFRSAARGAMAHAGSGQGFGLGAGEPEFRAGFGSPDKVHAAIRAGDKVAGALFAAAPVAGRCGRGPALPRPRARPGGSGICGHAPDRPHGEAASRRPA